MVRTGDRSPLHAPDDRELSNTQRADFANSVPGANVLISIHMNGSSNSATDYTTTLFGKWRKDKAWANALFGDPNPKGPSSRRTVW